MGSFEARTNGFEEVAVRPIMFGDERPEADDEGIDIGIKPGTNRGFICGRGPAKGGPFGGIFELFGSIREVMEPAGPGAFIEFADVVLGIAEHSEFAGFRIGIEGSGGTMPIAVNAEMDRGIEPITPAKDGAAGEFVAGRARFGCRWSVRSEVVMGEVVLKGKGVEGAPERVGRAISTFAKADKAGQERGKAVGGWGVKGLEEAGPGLAVLKGPIPGILFLGVFGNRASEEGSKPGLDMESGDVEVVVLFFSEGDGILHGLHDGEVHCGPRGNG